MLFKRYINNEYREEVAAGDEAGGGGEAPPAPVTEPEDTIPEETSLWDELSSDVDETETEDSDDSTDLASPDPEVIPEATAEPEPEPIADPPAVEPEPVAAAAVAEPIPEVQPIPEPTPEPVVQPPLEPTAEDMAKARADTEAALAERYSLSEDEALQLMTDPAKVFPKLQARLFNDMWEHMTKLIRDNLPEAIQYNVREMESRNEKVDTFFEAWPKLNRKEHGDTISQVAKVYTQVNPKATEEQLIRHVGLQAMLLHGITPDVPSDQSANSAVTATVVPPRQPAAVNGGSRPQISSDNIWESMSEDMEDD